MALRLADIRPGLVALALDDQKPVDEPQRGDHEVEHHGQQDRQRPQRERPAADEFISQHRQSDHYQRRPGHRLIARRAAPAADGDRQARADERYGEQQQDIVGGVGAPPRGRGERRSGREEPRQRSPAHGAPQPAQGEPGLEIAGEERPRAGRAQGNGEIAEMGGGEPEGKPRRQRDRQRHRGDPAKAHRASEIPQQERAPHERIERERGQAEHTGHPDERAQDHAQPVQIGPPPGRRFGPGVC